MLKTWVLATTQCHGGLHRLYTERLVLASPTRTDLVIATAAASDEDAQRWLGWEPASLIPEPRRSALLARRAGHGEQRPSRSILVAIDRASRRLAGEFHLEPRRHELGGWLAPEFRGRGLAREMMAAGMEFGHHHLAIATLRAGTEPANRTTVTALTTASFTDTTGPPSHRLDDGRTIPARWFQHHTDDPHRCDTS